MSGQEPRQHGDEICRDRLLFSLGAEIHRRAQVEEEPRGHFSVLIVYPDIRCLETRCDVPVNVTDIVVILVFAQIRQVQPKTAKQSLVIAVQQAIEATNHRPLQAPQNVFSFRGASCGGTEIFAEGAGNRFRRFLKNTHGFGQDG